LAKRLSEEQKVIIINKFKDGSSMEALSNEFNCTKLTIIRNLKKNLGEKLYKDLSTKNKTSFQKNNLFDEVNSSFRENKILNRSEKESNPSILSEFVEIAPLDFEIENKPRKELSSISIEEMEFPKVVYMVVSKNIELEIKFLKDYPEWEFLPDEDLNRKTIEIYLDLKIAKRVCGKDQKVIKVPNTDVFKIVSPILISRGISRIVSAEKLIAI